MLGLGQIFALIAEAPGGIEAGGEFAAWYNRHKPLIKQGVAAVEELIAIYEDNAPALDRIALILDDGKDNPLPPEAAKERAIEVLLASGTAPEAQGEARKTLASVLGDMRDQSGNN